jgi:hypothetical protein
MKFCGKYCGKYNKTLATGPAGPFSTPTAVTSIKGTCVVTISEVGCGAYLINIVKDNGTGTFNNLAYLEDNVLRASSGGNGIFSSYFEDNKLIAQASNRSNDGTTETWNVVNYSLKKYKC